MWAWLRGKGRVDYTVQSRDRPFDPDAYVQQLDDEITAAVHADDLRLVDELTAERCRVLLARGETP